LVPINKGNALLELGRYEEAIACYDEGLKFDDTEHSYLWVCKGIASSRLKRYQEAITCYDNALKFQPDLERALEEKQKALEMLNNDRKAKTAE
jgi:tetratricopeptide (TPR) repeat protein